MEKVFGITSTSNNSFTVNLHSGHLAYSAGCVAVLYDPRENKQVRFFPSRGNKTIQCLSFSSNGRYLAVGEVAFTLFLNASGITEAQSGHRPSTVVWDLETKQTVAELEGHKYGVGCVCSSHSGNYLVSVGVQHDGYIYFWDVKSAKMIDCRKTSSQVFIPRCPYEHSMHASSYSTDLFNCVCWR